MLFKNVTGVGEEDAFAAALEKVDPKGGLEIAHLLRDVGLRNPEPVGGAAEAARFRDREEIAQMPNLKRIVNHGWEIGG
jgi:hypothetical protein